MRSTSRQVSLADRTPVAVAEVSRSSRALASVMAIAFLVLFSVVFMAGSASADHPDDDTARLQVIHNAADPAAAVVDIYVNEGAEPFLDDFAFRAATPFVDVPAGVELRIGVAPGDSDSPDDIIASFPVTLKGGNRYVVVANGVLGDGFAPNPDGADIGFTLFAKDRAKERGKGHFLRVLAFHGSTDAPSVDIRRRTMWGSRPLFRDLSYGEFQGYRWLRARKYILDITPAGDPGTVVASYEADLSGLAGGAAVVFASGFLDPASNNDGAAFGLFAALTDGSVVPLPQEEAEDPIAKLQVIHNSADPAAAVVDIYVNEGAEPFINDFAFRTATPFVEVPAGVELRIGVAPPDSDSPDDIIATIPVTLETGERYVAIANGVIGDGFADNPDGADIGFGLFPVDGIKESTFRFLVKLQVFHGATDAPTVDILRDGYFGPGRLVNDLSYGNYSGYSVLLPRPYTLSVTPGGDNSTVVASYTADLTGLGGGAAVAFASGFLDPSANNGGPAFGLFVALPDGNVLELPAADMGESAAPALAKTPPSLDKFELGQNYPNPFNPRTSISFSLPAEGDVKLNVYNQRGELVRRLVDQRLGAGPHVVDFDGRGLASGMYFYRLSTPGNVESRKMILAK